MKVLTWGLRAVLAIGVIGVGFTLLAAFDLSSDPGKYKFPLEAGGACYASEVVYRDCLYKDGWLYAGLAIGAGVVMWIRRRMPKQNSSSAQAS